GPRSRATRRRSWWRASRIGRRTGSPTRRRPRRRRHRRSPRASRPRWRPVEAAGGGSRWRGSSASVGEVLQPLHVLYGCLATGEFDETLLEATALEHLSEGTRGEHGALGDDGDAIADALGELHAVAGEDDGAPGSREPLEHVDHDGRRYGVDGLERLVEHEQAR